MKFISDRRRAIGDRHLNDDGFTLIELLVAMIVGLVVLGIGVLVLVATNSASLRILSRSEVQQNTRQSISLMFSELSDAEALPQCRIGVDAAAQALIQDAGYPETAGTGVNPVQCKETSSSGYVLAYEGANRACFFKTEGPLTTQPTIQCISRGDWAPNAGDQTSFPTVNGCVANAAITNGRSPQQIFTFTCSASGGNLTRWPSSYNAPVADSLQLIADLGELRAGTTIPELFTPLHRFGATTPTIKDVLGLRINLLSGYDSKFNEGGDPRKNYQFSQVILLRGSEGYLEESANEY